MSSGDPCRAHLEPAYVLHGRPYRDTSLLLEVFTCRFGRVALIARGVRSAKSHWAGLLQPFQGLLVSWSGRGEVPTLNLVEAEGLGYPLRGENLISGFYLNELLMRLLYRYDPHPRLFEVYRRTLGFLGGKSWKQRGLRLFEKHLLEEIGYGLILDHDVETGQSIRGEQRYCYELEKGPVQVSSALPKGSSGGDRRTLIYGSTLLSLWREELNDPLSLRESKRLMRAALTLYLGDRPLQSRALLLDFYRASSRKTVNEDQ